MARKPRSLCRRSLCSRFFGLLDVNQLERAPQRATQPRERREGIVDTIVDFDHGVVIRGRQPRLVDIIAKTGEIEWIEPFAQPRPRTPEVMEAGLLLRADLQQLVIV